MATLKSRMRAAAKGQSLPSNSSNATMNRAGGVAFDIRDPATKLITMTGGSFFDEPRYYDGELAAKRVAATKGASAAERFNKLEQRIQVNQNSFSKAAVDEVTKEILATAGSIAEGPNPEDLLIIARWLRHEMNIRATPQALMVVASHFKATQPFVRAYAPVIAVRPDEIKTCLLMHRFFFGMKTLKNCLAQGLSDAMSKFNERALLKYDSPGWPTWRDVLQVLPRGNGRPLRRPLADYFLKGEVVDAAATPIVAARKQLNKLDKFDAEARDLAVKSMVNWEVLLSQFGKDKKAVWEFLIEQDLVGYMALLRNLRNMLQESVDDATIKKAAAKLSDPDEVVKSKQLPFRFLASMQALGVRGADTRKSSKLLTAVKLASNAAALNVPELPGLTAIFADNSGSMSTGVSGKSKMSCRDAANMLCGIVAARAEESYVCAFATEVAPVQFSGTDTVLDIAEKVSSANTKGWSTNGHRIIEFLIKLARQGIFCDRVIILSDMQMWNDSSCSDDGKCVADLWPRYLKSGNDAKKTWLHCVHLSGYGDSVVDEMAKVTQTGAFSEKIFSMLLEAEGALGKDEVPTVEQIREKYKL